MAEPAETLARESAVPLYVQLDAALRAKIASGLWSPGDRIPSENQLNEQFGVSRMTARAVVTTLVNEGLLTRTQGKGTFVALPKIDTIPPAYRGVREQLEQQGLATRTRVMSCVLETPGAHIRDALGMADDERAWSLRRVRLVEDSPISLHNSWIPQRLAPDLAHHDAGREQLCVILQTHYGLTMRRVTERLESVATHPDDALVLGLRPGAPVLVLEDRIFGDDETVFEFSRIVFRGDRVRLHFSYDL